MTSSVIDVNESSKQIDQQGSPENSAVDESSAQSNLSAAVEPRKLPGSQLKEARQKAGLSLSDVSKKLYISVRKLESLEKDSYHDLPSEVFIQGYIKKYSVIVNQNEDQLLADYEYYLKTQRAINPDAAQLNLGVAKRRGYSFLSAKWMVPTGLVVLSISVLVFVMTFTKQERPAMLSEINEAEQLPELPVSQLGSSTLDEMANELNALRGRSDLANDVSSDAPDLILNNDQVDSSQSESLVQAPQANGLLADVLQKVPAIPASDSVTTVSVPVGALDVLVFNVSEDCWIEVSDSAGSKMYSRLANAGQTIELNGDAPFSIMLGNARGIEMSVNGESVAINMLPGRDTARLVVGK